MDNGQFNMIFLFISIPIIQNLFGYVDIYGSTSTTPILHMVNPNRNPDISYQEVPGWQNQHLNPGLIPD